MGFLGDLLKWFGDLAVAAFVAAWDFFTDLLIGAFDLLLQAVAGLIALIPVPSFMSTGLSPLFSALGNDMLYVVGAAGVTSALGVVAAGYAFRFARKLVTLFQW